MKKASQVWRVFLVAALMAAVGLTASPALGASDKPPTIKTMKVSVWPEYDDPRVLVIYRGEFNDGSSFPQAVKFPVPMGSEVNQACALKQPGDEHLCQLYEAVTEQDSLQIAYSLPIPTYLLEYYWDGVKGQPDKSVSFKYVAPYAIDKLDLEVGQPLRATNFKLSPNYGTVNSDAAGMKYYHYTFSNVAAGQVINVDASYTKPDNKPSVAKKPGSGAASGGSPNTIVLIAVGAVGVAAIGFFALKRKPAPATARSVQARRAAMIEATKREAARRATRREAGAQPRPDAGSGAAPAVRQAPGGAVPAFCSTCGSKLENDDVFCSGCGEKVKRRS